ncbi:hypothetical protein CFP56_018580 [Quercus suber]|uniref:Uncharacterized protein n=1 Tax=Quercus suber TaxID=58331 RepID=A0AAW0M0B6_QUESU
MEKTAVKKKEVPGRRLVDLVLSWSIEDVRNEDLYKNQDTTNTTEERHLQNLGRPYKSIALLHGSACMDRESNTVSARIKEEGRKQS